MHVRVLVSHFGFSKSWYKSSPYLLRSYKHCKLLRCWKIHPGLVGASREAKGYGVAEFFRLRLPVVLQSLAPRCERCTRVLDDLQQRQNKSVASTPVTGPSTCCENLRSDAARLCPISGLADTLPRSCRVRRSDLGEREHATRPLVPRGPESSPKWSGQPIGRASAFAEASAVASEGFLALVCPASPERGGTRVTEASLARASPLLPLPLPLPLPAGVCASALALLCEEERCSRDRGPSSKPLRNL